MAGRIPTPILVVDDDPRVLRACEAAFAPLGYPVRTARNAEDALDDMRQRPAGALITELALPGMDGLTLIHSARRIDPQIAAIVLTGHPSARTASRALRMGVDDYLIKDADSMGHLRRAVPRALRRRAHEAETARLLTDLAALNEEFLQSIVELQAANLQLEDRLRPPTSEEGQLRVLVIDDDAPVVAVLETLLNSQPGMRVTGVTSAEEARAELEAGRFDLVMADKNLGDADGVDLIGEIHARWPETAVVLMTGYATLESAVAALEHGAVAYLRKPFDDLDAVLDRVAEVRRRIEEDRRRRRYLHTLRERNADFLARYRLIKNKLLTLQRESP